VRASNLGPIRSRLRALLLFSVSLAASAAVIPASAQAQSVIQSEVLGAADAYDAGILDANSGGLDAALWQGTSVSRAVRLMQSVSADTTSPVTRDLIKAAILSGGVPPRDTQLTANGTDTASLDFNDVDQSRAEFASARLRAIIALNDPAILEAMLQRAPSLGADPRIRTEIALLRGDTDAACLTTDAVQEGRAEPFWMRLRAVCHYMRDEIAAAELTTDLLRSRDYEDPDFFAAMNVLLGFSEPKDVSLTFGDPLIDVMAAAAQRVPEDGVSPERLSSQQAVARAQDATLEPDDRFAALIAAGSALPDADMARVLTDLAVQLDAAGVSMSFDMDSALGSPLPRAMGQLYILANTSADVAQAAKAIDGLLSRADAVGGFDRFAALLAPDIERIPGQIQAQFGVMNFVRAAVNRGDVNTLRDLYLSTDDLFEPRPRIALISDAMGNGFVLGDLGQDIEARLGKTGDTRRRAVRDSYIALSLGARLSDLAADILDAPGTLADDQDSDTAGEDAADDMSRRAVDASTLAALDIVAKAGSRGETALRAAIILGPKGPTSLDNASLYRVINALSTAGLTGFAGRVAAEDLLSSL